MFNRKILQIALTTLVVSAALTPAAFSQGTQTLKNPLIPGALEAPPGTCPDDINPPIPPAPGDGSTPAPVTPGIGSPVFEPWVPAIPANTIGIGSSGVPLPVGPPVTTPPGILGPSLTPFIPNPPSTPGAAPPWVLPPNGMSDTIPIVPMNVQGGLPGTGGYYTTIPKIRPARSAQDTFQGPQRRASILGGGGPTQDEVTLTGPLAGFGLPFGVPTGNGYNNGPPGTGSDLRLGSIDLGGGMRLRAGDCKISTGSTLQDYGNNYQRYNPIPGLDAQQSTEFGQGFRRMPIFSNKSTDFGFPLIGTENPANIPPQARGQFLNKNAVETNF